MIDPVITEIIKRCKRSCSFFIDNFCRVKHPKLGVIPFKLFSYQKRCLKEFRDHRFSIFRKCRQCFVAGSMVWTPDGPKKIETIKKGDPVYSLNQLTGQLEISCVDGVFDNGISECVEVRTKTGHRSISTVNHKYLSHDGYVEAECLTTNDRLVEIFDQPRYGNAPAHTSDPILLGYLLTDGGCNKNNFYFANSSWKYLLEYQKHYQIRFGRRPKIKKTKSGFKPDSDINYRITSTHADAQQWLGSYGLRGATGVSKKIPECVFRWNNESIALLLNRMFAGDGWYSGSHCNEVGIGQQSLEVLHQIKQLLSRFQISSKIYEETSTSIHKLRIFGGSDFARFVEKIGIFGKEPRCAITKGFFFNRQKGDIKSVKPIEGKHEVYDLSVPPHHNYIVDGAVVHNCGISTLTGSYALWYAMFKNNQTILIMSKRDDDAKEYLNRNVKFAYSHLPQWMKDLWKPDVINEHTLSFTNGSSIRSLTSSPDTLRSNASSLNIIDEAAFIDKMEIVWSGGWSTLQHGGEVIVVSCVPKGTYVFGKSGLTKIDKFVNDDQSGAYDIPNYSVLGKDGMRQGNLFYNNGLAETKKLVTRYGNMEGSLSHKLWACKNGKYDWHKLKDLNIGDWVSIQYGQEIWGNNDDIGEYQQLPSCKPVNIGCKITPQLAYFIGLYLAEGCCYVKRNKREKCIGAIYTLTCGDSIGHVFDNLGLHYSLNKDGLHYNISSKNLYRLLEHLGIDHTAKAPQKRISDRILQCSKDILIHVLRGLFDGDGGSRKDRGTIKYSTTSKELDLQIRMLLNNLGMVAACYVRTAEKANAYLKENPGKCNAKRFNHDSLILELDSYNSNKFYKTMGFGFKRKQDNHHIVEHVNIPGDSHDVIPSSLDYAIKMFDETPFGTWTFRKHHGLFLNAIVSKKTRYKAENLARKTMLKLFNISKKYLDDSFASHLNKILSPNLRWAKIVDVQKDYQEVYDFSLPNNNDDFWAHSVVYNGFLGHQTPKGVGNWYWKTWAAAVDKQNDFNPIIINWWDMDWELKLRDELSGATNIIAPTKGLVELENPREIEKYGPGPGGKTFWSPWLEGEYRNLATKGDDSKFRQEVLAEFIGSGDTVLSRFALSEVKSTTDDKWTTFDQPVPYVNPSVGEHTFLDFQELLWVWKKPYTKEDADKVIREASFNDVPLESIPYLERVPHIYAIGADPSSGEAADYCGIQVLDIVTQEQVAEVRIKALPKTFAKMIDYIGRWYNNALVVCERTGIGQAVVQELDRDLMYPNLYRHSKQSASLKTKYSQIGYPTSRTTKPMLIKGLIDNVGKDGYLIRSSRLYHEFCIFIHLGNNRYGNEPGTGNTDDVAMAMCLALAGVHDAMMRDNRNLFPMHNVDVGPDKMPVSISESFSKLPARISKGLMIPFGSSSEMHTGKPNKVEELAKFAAQLGGLPLNKNTNVPSSRNTDSVTTKKHILRYFRG